MKSRKVKIKVKRLKN